MLIEMAGIEKTYSVGEEKVRALRGVTFSIDRGEYVAIMGPSGSGKSTLMNLIGCLDTPTGGVYKLNGTPVQEMTDDDLARVRNREIGFVFQTFNLLPAFTALENVLLGMCFSGKGTDSHRATDLLTRVGLGHRLRHRPPQLSVGEQQRVAVARALANHPSLLLADEPTASVDVANQNTILDLIRDACRENNVSLLLVTHSPDVASRFDRIEKLSDFNRPS